MNFKSKNPRIIQSNESTVSKSLSHPKRIMASQSPRTGTPVKVFEGVLNLSPEDLGQFFGRGGESLRKFVTGKSFRMIKELYGENYAADLKAVDGNVDDKSVRFKTSPEDLGRILVKVNFPPKEELSGKEDVPYKVEILCDNEDLNSPPYHAIVKKNLDTHAKNCTVKKAAEDKFSHKIIFTADLDHEGVIGRFVGTRGKNIKKLSEDVKAALGVPFVVIKMIPASETLSRGPWKGKFIRLKTHEDNNFPVNIVVATNLPAGEADYKKVMKALVPIVNDSVQRLESDRFDGEESSEIMAAHFLDELSADENMRPNSPSYTPDSPRW